MTPQAQPPADPLAAQVTDPLAAQVTVALERLALPDRIRLLSGETFWQLAGVAAIGLRPVVLSDGPVGVRGGTWDERDVALTLPSPSALAASWDETLATRCGQALADEAARKGVDVVLAPTVNLQRSPLGGRHFECLSEDPVLTGRIGAALVIGLQSRGVGACVKHYVANDSETERMTVDVRVDDQVLREVYLAPFEHIVRTARPWSVMAAYNGVNGITMTESPLLTDPLAQEWGFDGVVISDWHAARSCEPAANAALDLVMPAAGSPWGAALLAAVRAGRVSEPAVEEKARRILRLAARVDALRGVARPDRPSPPMRPDSPPLRALAREAAVAGSVLLRNGGLLPLDRSSLRRVAVIGPNARPARAQGGGSATVAPPYVIDPVQGLRDALGPGVDGPGVEVTHTPGCHLSPDVPAVTAAQVRHPQSGEPGLLVRYLDEAGHTLAQEHRSSGRLGWHGLPTVPGPAAQAPDEPAPDEPAPDEPAPDEPAPVATAVEIEAVLTPPTGGLWRLGFGGAGEFDLLVDGDPLLTRSLLPAVEDFASFVHPTQAWAPVELTAGRPVRLLLRHRPRPVNAMVAVELNAEPPRPAPEAELAHAAELASAADVAVVVVGTTDLVESEGFDRTTLALPGDQDDLVRRVVAANPNTVVVVNAGAPVLMPWRAEPAALLVSWFGGQEAGAALADILLGDAEPGGRLPACWPDTEADCPVLSTTPHPGTPDPALVPVAAPAPVLHYGEGLDLGHRAWARQVRRGGPGPAYWFGYGLGYTEWAAEQIAVSPGPQGSAVVRARVRNVGARTGRTVIQVYLSRSRSTVPRPTLWLAGFAPVSAEPGEPAEAEITLPMGAFQHWTGPVAGGRWELEPGRFEVCCASDAGSATVAPPGWALRSTIWHDGHRVRVVTDP